MKKYLAFLPLIFAIKATATTITGDAGKISIFYATPSGAVAIQLDGGFPNSNAANQCPGAANWAGNLSADPVIKSALLAAKMAGQSISLEIDGCESNNAWLRIKAVYLR